MRSTFTRRTPRAYPHSQCRRQRQIPFNRATNRIQIRRRTCAFLLQQNGFFEKRYDLLHAECKARGFNVQYIWNEELSQDPALWLDYEPTETALALNRARIQERMPAKARFTPYKIQVEK